MGKGLFTRLFNNPADINEAVLAKDLRSAPGSDLTVQILNRRLILWTI
jgi:hypothetical protein